MTNPSQPHIDADPASLTAQDSATEDSIISEVGAGVGITALAGATPATAAILARALEGRVLSVDEGAALFEATGDDFLPVLATADHLRRQAVGDRVTYVVNRNINFTNVCVKRCGFCAFSRGHRAEEGYFLPMDEVVRRALEAREMGATEVCVQAGLPPGIDGWYYVDMVKALHAAAPEMHIHGCSPEEVLYGAGLAGVPIAEYLTALKDAGLGSLPGTSAEILVDSVRDVIAPGRITTAEWLDLIGTAHKLGIPTTSTIMFGHVETSRDKALHLDALRTLQGETGGFTEFVPLGFIFADAPMFQKRRPPGLRAGPSGVESLKMIAVARIMLHGAIDNIQVSWVKEGPKLAQVGLMAGANDLGGTLINESISTSAGAGFGQLLTPAALRAMARELGRVPVERGTDYTTLRVFTDPADDPHDALDRIEDPESQFGSYDSLVAGGTHRFKTAYQTMRTSNSAGFSKNIGQTEDQDESGGR